MIRLATLSLFLVGACAGPTAAYTTPEHVAVEGVTRDRVVCDERASASQRPEETYDACMEELGYPSPPSKNSRRVSTLPTRYRWDSCEDVEHSDDVTPDFECSCTAGSTASPVISYVKCMRWYGHLEFSLGGRKCDTLRGCDVLECELEGEIGGPDVLAWCRHGKHLD